MERSKLASLWCDGVSVVRRTERSTQTACGSAQKREANLERSKLASLLCEGVSVVRRTEAISPSLAGSPADSPQVTRVHTHTRICTSVNFVKTSVRHHNKSSQDTGTQPVRQKKNVISRLTWEILHHRENPTMRHYACHPRAPLVTLGM